MNNNYIQKLLQSCNYFENDRLQVNFGILKSNTEYTKISKQYKTQRENLLKELNFSSSKKLENTLETLTTLCSLETHFAYKCGCFDAIEILKSIKS